MVLILVGEMLPLEYQGILSEQYVLFLVVFLPFEYLLHDFILRQALRSSSLLVSLEQH